MALKRKRNIFLKEIMHKIELPLFQIMCNFKELLLELFSELSKHFKCSGRLSTLEWV